MFKKQVSWTDARQKFVHPIRKGDILKKNYNKCQVFDACSSLNQKHWFPLFQKDTETRLSYYTRPPDTSYWFPL